MASKVLCCVAGGLVHTAVLVAPLAIVGRLGRIGQDPVMAVFLILGSLFYVAELSAMAHAGQRGPPARRAVDRLAHWLALAASLAVLALSWAGLLERAAHSGPVAWYQPVGAVAMLVGIALRRGAIRQLGEHFVSSVSVPDRRPLLQHGIYARLRHPSESGLLLLALGTAVLLGSGAATVLALGVLLPLIVVRLGIEDRCLLAAFGGEFQSYRNRVPALLPCFLGGITATGRSTRTIAPPRLMPYNDTIGRAALSGSGAVDEPPGAAP